VAGEAVAAGDEKLHLAADGVRDGRGIGLLALLLGVGGADVLPERLAARGIEREEIALAVACVGIGDARIAAVRGRALQHEHVKFSHRRAAGCCHRPS